MFNIYSFEKKVKYEEEGKIKEAKNQRIMSTHRKQRDSQAENYQKRVAMFIREMVDKPVLNNDDYTQRTTLNTSKNSGTTYSHFTSFNNDGKSNGGTSKSNTLSSKAYNNRYGHKSANSTARNTMDEVPTRDFRFSSYRTEKERIQENIIANQQF
jgi:hypothetical protein